MHLTGVMLGLVAGYLLEFAAYESNDRVVCLVLVVVFFAHVTSGQVVCWAFLWVWACWKITSIEEFGLVH